MHAFNASRVEFFYKDYATPATGEELGNDFGFTGRLIGIL